MEGIVEWNHNSEWFERTPYRERVIGADTLINTAGRDGESLNGEWNFAPDLYDMFFLQEWWREERKVKHQSGENSCYDYSFNDWDEVPVPSCVNLLKPELKYFEGTAVYTRKFEYAPHEEGERVFLRLGAAQYRAAVFVNREYKGMHLGGSTPFNVEITGDLEPENRVTIAVDCARNQSHAPMHFTDWFNYGGLYREVEIIRTPSSFIKDYFVRLVPDGEFNKIAIDIEVDNPNSNQVEIIIPELGIDETMALDSNGRGNRVIEAVPELWRPGNPKLYEVEIRHGDDRVTEKIGFREIRVEGREIILNGEAIWLRGISCHEDSVENGKSLSRSEVAENFALARELNCNFMRLAHYPHQEYSAELADELGILLWSEIPVYWGLDFSNQATYRDAANQLAEMVRRDRNRASVVIWSVGNENVDSDERFEFLSKLATDCRSLDDSRLVSAACLTGEENGGVEFIDRLTEKLDVIGFNEYFGWYRTDFETLAAIKADDLPAKPVIITEMGAGAPAGHHGGKDQMWTEEYQDEVYKKQVEIIAGLEPIKGMTPWILHDFRAPFRLNIFQNGYNRKGLLSEDKKHRKLAFHTLRGFYRRMAGDA